MSHSRNMTVSDAISKRLVAAPPELREEMICAQVQLAEACDNNLVPVRDQLKYKGEIDGPTLLVHDDCLFELVDVYHPATSSGRIAATRDGTWFRLIPRAGATESDLGFLTWCYQADTWHLAIFDQHLA